MRPDRYDNVISLNYHFVLFHKSNDNLGTLNYDGNYNYDIASNGQSENFAIPGGRLTIMHIAYYNTSGSIVVGGAVYFLVDQTSFKSRAKIYESDTSISVQQPYPNSLAIKNNTSSPIRALINLITLY